MSDQSETIEQREMEQAATRLRFAITEARAFEAVQKVFFGVEKTVLSVLPGGYDTRPAINAARSLSEAINEKDSARVAEAEDHFANELLLWRLSLSSRDDAIQPYDLRRFCERAEVQIDGPAYTALTRFYRSRPYSDSSQRKYDFCVTQLNSKVDEQGRYVVPLESTQLVAELKSIFATWELEPAQGANEEVRQSSVQAFREFIDTANQLNDFDGLIASGLLSQIRLFKSNLGDTLYAPEVTAAAIECSVAVANRFAELRPSAGAPTNDAPEPYAHLSSVLGDATTVGFFSGAMSDAQMAELDHQVQSGAQLEQLMRLLRVSQTAGDESADQSDSEEGEADYCVSAELSETLRVLAEDDENKAIVAAFLRTPLSEERKAIDPAIFLGPLVEEEPGQREEERQARRGALELILRAEKLLFTKLAFDDPITSGTEAELAQLLEQMQLTDSTLRRLISEARAASQLALVDQLLHISNHLLGSRLSMQSAIVARGAEELARQEQLANLKIELEAEPRRVIPWGKMVRIAAVVLVMAACALLTMRALTLPNTAAEARSKDVDVLDPKAMPGAEVLIGARLKRPVLVVIVAPAWSGWPETQKRDELKALLKFGQPLGVNTVMLVDSSGAQRGSANESSVNLDSDPARR